MNYNKRRFNAFWLGGWFSVWIAGATVVAAGIGAYSSNRSAQAAKDAAKAGQIDPNQVANTNYDIQRRLGPGYTRQQSSNIQQGLLGNIDWGHFARTPQGSKLLADSESYYADNPDFANPETRLQDMYNNGYLNPADLPHDYTGITSTLADIQHQQDISNADSASYQRTRNFQDMAGLAPGAAALSRTLNPEYYSALNKVSEAAAAPIAASPYEDRYGAIALGPSSPTFSIGTTARRGAPRGGGYTGRGGRNQPAGVVHRGEYVVPARAVDAIGVGKLDQMTTNAQGELPGYASGGLVTTPGIDAGGTDQGPGGMGDFTLYTGGGFGAGGPGGMGDFGMPGGNMGPPDALGKGGAMTTGGNMYDSVLGSGKGPYGPVRQIVSDKGVDMVGGGGLTTGLQTDVIPPVGDKFRAPGEGLTTGLQTPDEMRQVPTRGPNSGGLQAAIPPQIAVDGPGFGDDMRYPGEEGPSGGMELGEVNERVAGPGSVTRRMTRDANNPFSPINGIEGMLGRQAQSDLALGGNLSLQEQRNATAASAAATGARGLGDTNSALAGEVLNLDSARQARLEGRRGFAMAVGQQLRSGQASDRGYGLSLDAASANRTSLTGQLQQMNITNRLNAANFNASQRQADLAALAGANSMYQQRNTDQFGRLVTSANLSSANMFNPYSVLGGVGNQINSQGFLGQGMGYYTGVPDYASGAAQNNANANAAGGIGAANGYASLAGGMYGLAGSLGSAYISNRSQTTTPPPTTPAPTSRMGPYA